MDKKPLVAELIGTFALCFIGILSIDASKGDLMIPAFAHGLVLVVFISAFGAVSGGHFNPAVTLAMIVSKRIKPDVGIAYMVSQVLGGVLAGLAVIACGFTVATVTGGTPAPGPTITMMSAIIAETILTAFLVFAVLGTAVDKRAPKIGGIGIGLTVTFDILAGGPISGGAMNPARWLGPALVSRENLGNAAIYLTGPFIGCILAVLIYDKLIAPDQVAA